MTFKLPQLGSVDRWGPPDAVAAESSVNKTDGQDGAAPGQYSFFAPFSAHERLGKIADWAAEPDRFGQRHEGGRQGRSAFNRRNDAGVGANPLFGYAHTEDEASFSLVDNRTQRTQLGRGRGGARGAARGGLVNQRAARGGFTNAPGGSRGGRGGAVRGGTAGFGRGGRRGGWKDDRPTRLRDASIAVKPDWQLLEEIEFPRLSKLNLEVAEGQDLETCGSLHFYDRSFDRVSVKQDRPLVAIDRVHYNPTTTEDPVIQRLSQENKAQIFATDSILSMLMCASRTIYPWDIVVTRQGEQLFFDKREGGPFDYLTVNENAFEAPLEAEQGTVAGINTPNALSLEATFINHNFALQVLEEGAEVPMPQPNPFYDESVETEPAAPKAYKYKSFDISLSGEEEEPILLVTRTEVDGILRQVSGEEVNISIKALNEFDSKAPGAGGAIDWRSKLDTQRGAIVATEMKNNSAKLARWAAQSILAGCDTMKLGFVSRVNPRDAQRHAVLAIGTYKPREFAAQMNFSLSNGWGVVRSIVDVLMRQPEGKYIIVKDPNRAMMRLYAIPSGDLE
ncbi:hypothetical protein PYCC9005_002234 [Savitreella phatthalungensis]